MSTKELEKTYKSKFEKYRINSGNISRGMFLGLSNVIIPFSKFLKGEFLDDIYNGKEKILFSNKDPRFKTILRQEFLNVLFKSN